MDDKETKNKGRSAKSLAIRRATLKRIRARGEALTESEPPEHGRAREESLAEGESFSRPRKSADSLAGLEIRRRADLLPTKRRDSKERRVPRRSERSSREETMREPEEPRFKVEVGVGNYLMFTLLAVALSLTFYSFPLLHHLPTNSVSQNLYSGLAMNQGQHPYINFVGNQGPIFYLLNQLGTMGGGTWLLWLFEVLALVASAAVTCRFIIAMTRNQRVSSVVGSAVILAAAGISQGGDSAVIFALPLALYGIYHITFYLEDQNARKDEVFILYGMAGALASMIYPLFLLVCFFGFFALLAVNIREQLMARALYQFLAGLFGFLVVYALIGYYTLTTQIFYPAIEQAFILPFTHLNFGRGTLVNLLIVFGLMLLFGLLTSWFMSFRYMTVWNGVLTVLAILVAILVAASPSFVSSDALAVLPFAFIFGAIRLHRAAKEESSSIIHLIGAYFRVNLAFPVFGILFLIGLPIYLQVSSSSLTASQRAVASYVSANTKPSDRIFVNSNSKNIYILSQRVSTFDPAPSYYPTASRQAIDTSISSMTDKYVVLDKSKATPSSLTKRLSTDYKQVSIKDNYFTIYQKK